MKHSIVKISATAILLAATAMSSMAQDSGNTGVRRRSAGGDNPRGAAATEAPGVSDRMQMRIADPAAASDADMQWMRVIYRAIDLEKDVNAPLYFPEEPIEGQENLFRIIMRLLASGQLNAYEYLDGREVFTDQYRVKVQDVLDRFHILYTTGRGHTERNPRFVIDESDVPSNEVLSYYVIENWEFDTRNNRLRPRIEAICPVLHRAGDFGGEAVRYPMFWVRYNDLRPWLAAQSIFVSDNNNLPTCTYDDFFTLNLYQGDIYKTRNLRNRSMMQLYPDPDDLRRAQDSIQAILDGFEAKLWVPTREEVIAAREAREAAEAGVQTADAPADSTTVAPAAPAQRGRAPQRSSRRPKKKVSNPAPSAPSTGNSGASRSVRRRR